MGGAGHAGEQLRLKEMKMTSLIDYILSLFRSEDA